MMPPGNAPPGVPTPQEIQMPVGKVYDGPFKGLVFKSQARQVEIGGTSGVDPRRGMHVLPCPEGTLLWVGPYWQWRAAEKPTDIIRLGTNKRGNIRTTRANLDDCCDMCAWKYFIDMKKEAAGL